MENPPGRYAGVRPDSSIFMAGMLWLLAAVPAIAVEPLMMAEFPALPGGSSCQSALVPLADAPLLVTVVPPGANPLKPSPLSGGTTPSLRVIAHDPVSRLAFLELRGLKERTGGRWLESAGGCVGASVTAVTVDGPVPCRIIGWEKQVGGKILPLALLKVEFQNGVPPPGTPLVDSQKRIAGVIFQQSGNSLTGFAIPAEAVHRVRRDVCNGGVLVRGRLGLTLNAQNPSPLVVRVLPGSAAAAGIRPADVLLRVGTRNIRTYADVPDAFFYLIPGQPIQIAVQRGSQRIELSVTPARSQ